MREIRILFVEDDPTHAAAYLNELYDASAKIALAGSVEKALALVDKEVFDAVILDLLMPRGPLPEDETEGTTKTGLALARRIRRKMPSTPVLFLTIARDTDVQEWCKRNEPAAYLLKAGLSYGELTSQIMCLLSRVEDEAIEFIRLVASRFGYVATRLRQRYDRRPTFEIMDEYDVQDLLSAILVLKFDDVRREEWNPSSAGSASRADFLIKTHGIVIEVKRPRVGQSDRTIGEQLIVDIARYRAHPDCRSIFCFIYDPDGIISNPGGLGVDVERFSTPEFRVIVAIVGPLGYYSGVSTGNHRLS